MHQATFVLLAVCLVGAAPIKGDLKKVQGTWQPTMVETNGTKLDHDDLQILKVTVDGDKYTVRKNGEVIDRGTLKLHEDKKPKQFDDTSAMGEQTGMTAEGIYELNGDTWKVCLAEPGKARPKDFKADEGSGHTLYVMKKTSK